MVFGMRVEMFLIQQTLVAIQYKRKKVPTCILNTAYLDSVAQPSRDETNVVTPTLAERPNQHQAQPSDPKMQPLPLGRPVRGRILH
jgi:hypothetical protein